MTTAGQDVNPAESPADRAVAVPPRACSSAATLALQLLFVLWVVREWELEQHRGLFALLLLATVGKLIHSLLSSRVRPLFFLILSLASFPLALAWPQLDNASAGAALAFGCQQSAYVFAIGLILIGICHLPTSLRGRVFLIASVSAGLLAWRWQEVSPFWAVLGSIFMFRLGIYLKALRQESEPVPWTQRLTYFFLFSNGFFPFFPIIDYRKFRDGYVASDDGSLSQRGVAWIVRGIIHLLLYRTIKTFWLPGPADLIDAEYLALFLVTNYALYLRISGHFHIVTGLLHLFGYRLPRTHDCYFLASSFSDIWRRINIYWKDFLADHVFFPVYFSLANLPKSSAIVGAVLATFVATWFLHSWQVFWLLGHFPIGLRDAVLWLAAGSLVALNSLRQYRKALRPSRPACQVTVGSALRFSVQVVATFLAVSFFWACWTVPLFPQRVAAVVNAGGFGGNQVFTLAVVLVAVLASGTVIQLSSACLRQRGTLPALSLERSPGWCLAILGLLALIAAPNVQQAVGPSLATKVAALTVEATAASQLELQARGYYEPLADANLQANPLLDQATPTGQNTVGDYWEGTRQRADALGTELIPGWQGTARGAPLQVNRWGMRDEDLPRRKPPGTYRIAMLGSSVTMGYGVAADADFESLLERRLNEQMSPGGPRVELLNFAVGGYFALHSAITMRENAFAFAPDAIVYVAHQAEAYGLPRHLGSAYKAGYSLPYPCLTSIIRDAGISDATSWGTAELLLQPHAKEIVACVYRGIVDDCRHRGILPVWVYLPIPGISAISVDNHDMLQLGHEAGFVVIDLSDWSEGYQPHDVKFTAGDFHLNEFGHQLAAEQLYERLQRSGVVPPSLRSP